MSNIGNTLFSCLGDPKAFGKNILNVYDDNGEITRRYEPHEGQRRLITAHNRIVLCTAGNSAGKTWAMTIKHLYYCIFKIGHEDLLKTNPEKWLKMDYVTLNCSFEYNIAQLVYDNIVELSQTNPLFDPTNKNFSFITRMSEKDRCVTLFNNAKFRFASLEEGGKHAEGRRFKLITVDEVGHQAELEYIYKTILQPRTFTPGGNGITCFIGTPKLAKQDPWVGELKHLAEVEDDITYIKMPTSENTVEKGGYLTEKDIEEQFGSYKDYPAEMQMVFYGELLEGVGTSVSQAQIVNATDYTLPNDPRDRDGNPTKSTPLMFGTQTKIDGHKYVSFWDIAMETDWSVGATLDVTSIPFRLVNFTRVNRSTIKGWAELFELMRREYERYGCPQHYDSTGQIGGKLQEDFKRIALENNYRGFWAKPMMILGDKGKKKPYQIGKEELINCLTLAFSYRQPVDDDSTTIWGKVRIPNIRQLVKELSQYHPDDKKIKETDSVIALAGALAVAPNPDRKLESGFIGNSKQPRTFFRNPAFAQRR